MCALVKNFYGTGNWMGTGECLGYKYLFDVDGNTWSQRFETFLWGGSLVFRMSLFSNWFDQYILPDVHYIHLNVTLSDLESRLAWAMKHDAEAERMARKAAEVAAARLRIADMECYLYRLLLEYAQLGEEVYLGD
ncbi:glycosyl transferase family 90-domain-containing protein, partial [Hyaloraphidium curvatum]